MADEQSYSIPLRFRKMENLHIVFWLFKDVSWCMVWKPLGIAMIFPTLIISIVIAWRTRELVSELTHNLAITFWITANAYWMISEFFSFDTHFLFSHFTFHFLLFGNRSETHIDAKGGNKINTVKIRNSFFTYFC